MCMHGLYLYYTGDSASSRGVLFTVYMDMDGIENRQKKVELGHAVPIHGGAAEAHTTAGSAGRSLTDQTDRVTWDPFKHYAYHENAGGYGFALACMLVAFLARWSLDVYLNDALPYATFIIACVIVAVYCGIPACLIAVAVGGVLSNFFFVSPRYELSLTGLLDQAGMAIYLTISLAAVGLLQTWRWAWKETEQMTKDLNRQMTAKSSTKE